MCIRDSYQLIRVLFGSLVRKERVSGASMLGIVLSIVALVMIVEGSEQ
jgi:uncharacterized membrane protein